MTPPLQCVSIKRVALAGQKHERNEYNPIEIVFECSPDNVETRLYSNVTTFEDRVLISLD